MFGDLFFILQVEIEAADLLNVALHEIGHVLGLPHSPHRSAVLYWTVLYLRRGGQENTSMKWRKLMRSNVCIFLH